MAGIAIHTGPLSAEAQALAADPDHLKLAWMLAARAAKKRPRLMEELHSAALLGLVEAARSFDPARGFRFGTHATPRILGSIVDAQRDLYPKGYRRRRDGEIPRTQSLLEIAEDAEGERASLAETIPSDDMPVGWEIESEEAVRAMLGPLPASVRRAMLLLYTESRCHGRQSVAARILGVGEPYVSELHNRGLSLLLGFVSRPSPTRQD